MSWRGPELVHAPVLEAHVRNARVEPRLRTGRRPGPAAAEFPVLRCSAIPLLEVPAEARRIELDTASTTREVQNLFREHDARATVSCQGTTVARSAGTRPFWGAVHSWTSARRDGAPTPAESWALGLVYDAGASARPSTTTRPVLRRTGSSVIGPPDSDRHDDVARNDRCSSASQSAYSEASLRDVPDSSTFAEAIQVAWTWLGSWWAVFDPFTGSTCPGHGTGGLRHSGRRLAP